ncbi:MAG: RraA family protein [Terriglobia bacterium]
MNKLFPLANLNFKSRTLAIVVMAGIGLGAAGRLASAQTPALTSSPNPGAALLDGFRRVEAASVSDAVEQITGRRMYMTHRMRPIFTSKFAGLALTVLLKKQEGHQGSQALSGMLSAIDQGGPNSVYVMVVEDGADIAGMGGLMGTAMAARNFSGAVIDGGVRDVAYLRKIRFPVFALGIVPSTSVNHYRFAGANIPVVSDGVAVRPNDIVVADEDGVVVVPRAQAAAVLALAQKMDFKEHSMYPYIEKFKSIEEAVRKFGRI